MNLVFEDKGYTKHRISRGYDITIQSLLNLFMGV